MTDRDVVDRVGNLFERAVIRLRRRRPHHKIPYATTIKGAPAVRIMCLRPFLGKARQLQIDRAISSWRLRKSGRRLGTDGGASLPHVTPVAVAASDLFTVRRASQEACDRAWLAGLLEGEGSFLASWDGQSSYPVIKVEMCEQDVVERVADLLNTRLWVEAARTERWRPTYVAQIAGHHAAGWMGALRPYMGLRRTAAIDVALAVYNPIRLTDVPVICVVQGCERPHRSRGLCNSHYCRSSRPQDRQVRGLHELVARPRKGPRPEDHAAALIRSSWSRVPYLSRLGSCLELFARSFGCAATSTGSAACGVDRRSARSEDGFGLFVWCGADAGRAGASRRVAGVSLRSRPGRSRRSFA